MDTYMTKLDKWLKLLDDRMKDDDALTILKRDNLTLKVGIRCSQATSEQLLVLLKAIVPELKRRGY